MNQIEHCITNLQQGINIMDHDKSIFETIIDVLRRANIGFSINEVKDVSSAIKIEEAEQAQENIQPENISPSHCE